MNDHDDMQDMGWVDVEAAKQTAQRVAQARKGGGMTIPAGFAAVVRATVQQTGEVRAFGKAYWSAEMPQYAGHEVTLRLPDDEWADAQVWQGHDFLCSAAVIRDLGWGDPEMAKRSARKVAERRQAERTELVGLAREVIAVADELRLAGEKRAISEALSRYPLRLVDEEAQLDRVPLLEAGELDQGLQPEPRPAGANAEVLQDIFAALQAIEARLDAGLRCCGTPASALPSQPQTSASELSGSSDGASIANAQEAIPAAETGHRLSEVAK